MKEIINSILEAEEKARIIVETATYKSNSIILAADKEAERIREKAVSDFKDERKKRLAAAEKQAASLYDKYIADSEKSAEQIKKEAFKNADKCVEFLMKELTK